MASRGAGKGRTKKSSKAASSWACTDCGSTTQGWFGRCPHCGAWNTIQEQVELAKQGARTEISSPDGPAWTSSTQAAEVGADTPRLKSGIGELDRVLGGGLVPGSLVLLGGMPGIGKSTLLLQACAGWVDRGAKQHENFGVLYASGEESVAQVGDRAKRLNATREALWLSAQTKIEAILRACDEAKPKVLIVDSVQTIYSDQQDGLPGNVSQIRSVTGHLLSYAKREGLAVVVVGHVTKDGNLAGPRLLEHMVDCVLNFEGDEERATRMLRASKNRFGSTEELGVFEMSGEGLREVENPSEAFMGEGARGAVGACVTPLLEGARPLLVELQALLGTTPGGSPRRTCVGFDSARVAMLLAVLDRHAGLFVSDQDVFVNVAGGIKITDPAADLALALALASSHKRVALPPGTLALGELGLTGSLRPAARLEARITEAGRLGFKRLLAPPARKRGAQAKRVETLAKQSGLQVLWCPTIAAALDQAF